MREYAKVAPTFWTGETGKEIRRQGPEAVIVGMYLMTSPMSNMLGLFCQPILYMAHETGLGLEGAWKGLRACIEVGFCQYDEATETVWVQEMAGWQIAKQLKASDNRCMGIQRDYDALPKNPYLAQFFDHYRSAFHLSNRRGGEGASKALLSKEQEQAKEQEKEQKEKDFVLSPDGDVAKVNSGTVTPHPADLLFTTVLAAYHDTLPKCQRIVVLNPKRKKRIQAADRLARDVCKQQGWGYNPKNFWAAYFDQCLDDAWLRGDTPNPKNPTWKQNLDVLLAEDRFAQIMDRAIAKMMAGDEEQAA